MYFYDCLNDIKHFLAFNFLEFREKMEYKKTIILLALVVFLLSIAGVSASEIGDTIASENANTIELSTDNDIIEDNLQTSEENEALASTDYDEAIAQTDTEVLGADSAKYSDLAEEISQPGNINLTHKNYTYDKGETITISEDNKVIDGNGAVIDMNGSTIRAFTVYASGVTIKNLTIKNANYNGDGGAIYFSSLGTVSNCNFVNNSASNGGAVYFSSNGDVTNCNFVNNTASEWGGAIKFSVTGTVTNCNFTNNTATSQGGAIRFSLSGTVTNCNFADNSASSGGAIFSRLWYTTADTCIFIRNSGGDVNTVIYPPTLNVDNFTTVYGSGEKLTFDLKTNSSIPVTNGNILISVYFKDNGEWVRNYTCLSGEGWIPDLPVGSYIAVFNTEYAEFQRINRTITITAPEHTFWFLNYTINGNDNPVIELSNDFYFDPAYDAAFVNGIVINRPVTIKGNGNTIDAKRQARIFYVQSANAVLENLTLKNAHSNSEGGAVYFSSSATSGTVSNCNFVDNKATGDYGGAIFIYSGTVSNCNFVDNKAAGDRSYGGAVYFLNTGTVSNCNFTDNTAYRGGAVYFNREGNVTNCNFINNNATGEGGAIRMSSGTVTNCNFTNNKATGDSSYGGAIRMSSGTVTNCNFTGNTATYDGGAVYFLNTGTVSNCNFTNNTADYAGAVYFQSTGTVVNCNFTGNNATTGSAIYFYKWYSSDTLTVSDSTFLNNRANAGALDIVKTENNITITFTGQNNLLNAIYSSEDAEVTFTNVTYWGAKGITTVSATMSGSNKATGQNITVGVVVNNELVLSDVMVTNESGMIVLDMSAGENYYISVRHDTDSYYTEAERTISNNTKFNVNVTSQTTNNKTVNITAKSNIYSEVMPGKLLFLLPNGDEINATYGANGTWWAVHTFDDYGEYKVNASYVGLDNVTVNNGTITINKVNSTITLDNIVLDYGESINVTVTTTGATGITANLNGTNVTVINNYTILISDLAAGNYTLTVTTIPDKDHNPVTATSKITVNKVESTLTVDDIVFDYGNESSGDVSFTGASQVIANVVNQPSAVVNVNGNKISVSGLAAGTYTLNVTTVPDENHTAVTETSTITVNKVNSTLTLDNVELDYGETKNITVTAEGATGITAEIDGVNVTVNGYTIPISGLGAGNYKLTVTTIPDNNHNPITKEATITVNKLSTEITLANETLDLKVNDEFAVLADLTPAGAGNLTYSSSNESVVKVSDVGLITALGNGTSTVTVSFAGNDNYTAAQNKTISVTVSLKDSSVSAEDITLDVGVNATITSVTAPEGLEVTYIPDNSGVVTVENGVVTAVKEGTAKITLTVGGDGVYAENSTTITVTVNKLNATAEVSIPENITVGDNSTVNVVLPSDATGNVTVKVDGEVVDTVHVKDGNADVTIPSMSAGNHTVEIAYSGDDKYNPINETKEISVSKKDTTPEIRIPSDIKLGDNATVDVKLPSDASGNVTLTVDGKVVGTVPVTDGTASVKLPALDAGNHTAEIAYSGDDKYKSASKTATITVDKDSTNITAANVTATYSVNKYLVITLKDSHDNPLANSTVTVELSTAKNYTTDENGQVKVKVSNLVPKTYAAKITFKGDDNYAGSDAIARVVVKKATPKLTAKAKTFKTTTKTKKYTITLKNKNGKGIRNAQLTLKVNGKTYKATTNSKGKATFKITQLNKKGTFKATVTFKGSKYYKKVTKKVSIKVKSVWKTVQKGSKKKAIVKKIQRALKNHGYYLTYNGRYLKVDGIFWDYTKMAVKQFQNAKTLKVTGKVDEKTAKKLGII